MSTYTAADLRRALKKVTDADAQVTLRAEIDTDLAAIVEQMVLHAAEAKGNAMLEQGMPDEMVVSLASTFAIVAAFNLGLAVAREIETKDSFEQMMKDGGWGK